MILARQALTAIQCLPSQSFAVYFRYSLSQRALLFAVAADHRGGRARARWLVNYAAGCWAAAWSARGPAFLALYWFSPPAALWWNRGMVSCAWRGDALGVAQSAKPGAPAKGAVVLVGLFACA